MVTVRASDIANTSTSSSPSDGDGPASIAHSMASAARWCSFWASRGVVVTRR